METVVHICFVVFMVVTIWGQIITNRRLKEAERRLSRLELREPRRSGRLI